MITDFLSKNSVAFSAAFAAAFVLVLIFGRLLIPALKKWQRRGQPVRTDGIQKHVDEKKGTPTMGGLVFIPAIITASLLFMDWSSLVAWTPLIALVLFGAMGFLDDYNKVIRGNAYAGLSEMGRLLAAGVIAVFLSFLIDMTMPAYVPMLSVVLPFGIILPLGMLYFVWSYLVIVGTANAANITDGLDGMLAKVILCPLSVLVVALVGITRVGFMPSLIFLPEAAALFPIFGATMGAVMGFLWFNAKPASIFMGDVGALALGGLLGTSALLMKSEIVMAVASAVMVLVLLSSFAQMMYYRFVAPKGKPPFLMAPLHHHLELKGWSETKIVERFFIASIIFAGIAIAVLKL
ncbi:MAG: phospho-N-acetylmuramoyl-pentapeptide-transferase [Rickettsiales bacterium]|jgi:phospho-N-acetylmuramoyl-pentapeptide-transferase|nr:phospho-N-acetylmuramoyl-pentapeptide-transferase [Rickettsiales bacterium]